MYVASKCFILQVFYGGTLSDGRTARALGRVVTSRGPVNEGATSWGLAPRSRPCEEREEWVRGKERSTTTGQDARARRGWAALSFVCEEQRAQR